MKFQKKHHGIEIPANQQPRCRHCGGGMTLSIMIPNATYAEWYCLDNCEDPLGLKDWLAQYPVSEEIRKYFADVAAASEV